MPDDEISDCDVYEYCYKVRRITVETADVTVRLYGNISETLARLSVEGSLDRGHVTFDRAVRTDVEMHHVVPVWAVDRPARED